LNPTNPIGTVQSIEHTLRSLDKLAAEQQGRATRAEKELVDYQAQADRPFEHEERLKQLLARQSELNSQLDLDKGDQQGADSAREGGEDLDKGKAVTTVASPEAVVKMAETYMRETGTAIREMPILRRSPPAAGSVIGRAVAKDDFHIAVATAANRFIVVESSGLGRDVQIGDRLSLLFSNGRPSIDIDHGRER
jgi:chromosome segregation ATPase